MGVCNSLLMSNIWCPSFVSFILRCDTSCRRYCSSRSPPSGSSHRHLAHCFVSKVSLLASHFRCPSISATGCRHSNDTHLNHTLSTRHDRLRNPIAPPMHADASSRMSCPLAPSMKDRNNRLPIQLSLFGRLAIVLFTPLGLSWLVIGLSKVRFFTAVVRICLQPRDPIRDARIG